MTRISLPQLCWDDVQALRIDLPDNWQTRICRMAGHAHPALPMAELRKALRHPHGAPPISIGARGKKQICVLFDDVSRPTRAASIVPHILDELRQAGVHDDQIRFVCALGAHGAMTRRDFARKLGDDVVARFPVFNHNVTGNCTHVGTTSTGIDLAVNSEVVACDYKISIGSVVPHAFAGFGGGAKIILPGVASLETIRAMHRLESTHSTGGTLDLGRMGSIEGNRVRQSIEEAAEAVGLDFTVNALVDEWGETVSLYAGAPRAAFEAAVGEARHHYRTNRVDDCDIVVTNTFAKASEGEGGTVTGFPSLRPAGGDLVLINNAPEGRVTHYLLGTWGTLSPGEFRLVVQLPPQVERLIVFNEYKDAAAAAVFAPSERVLLLDRWDDVLRVLRDRHGDQAAVAVYPSADIQYLDDGPVVARGH